MNRRLLLVSLTPFFGGGEVYYERLCRLLGADFEISAIVADAELARRLALLQVDVTLLPEDVRHSGLRRLRCASRHLRNIVQERRVSIVHLNGQAESLLIPLCRRLNVRIVLTRHSDLHLRSGMLKRALYRRNAARADAVICVSSPLVREHEGFVDKQTIHLIPHWFEINARAHNGDHDPFTLLYIGRVEPEKGVTDLVSAVRELPCLQLLIAGDGILRERLQQDSTLKNVELLGFQNDLSALFARADLLVHPSHSEGSSLAVLEAMAAGVPSLVSDIPVLREIARDGECAELFPCGDSAALARQITYLRSNTRRRQELVQNAMRMIQSSYSPAIIRQKYLEVLTGATLP